MHMKSNELCSYSHNSPHIFFYLTISLILYVVDIEKLIIFHNIIHIVIMRIDFILKKSREAVCYPFIS